MLEVSTSGFWAWRKRPLSHRELANRELFGKIAEAYKLSRDTYGALRMHDELTEKARKRIARLMRAGGLVGATGEVDRPEPPSGMGRLSPHRIWSTANSEQRRRIGFGVPTSPTSAPGSASSTWPLSSTPSVDALGAPSGQAGTWPIIYGPSW